METPQQSPLVMVLYVKKNYNIMSNKNNEIDLESLPNNEILFQIKQMEADHEALKLTLIKYYDELVEIEKKFDKANKILLKRLKGE